MAIVSFWSDSLKETNQTLSLVAIATYMSIEHNYKTLIIDANLNDEVISRCFWKDSNEENKFKNEINRGKIDVVAGTEGLLSAVLSNKTTPEIIASYTKVVFKNRLDILLGLKPISNREYEKYLELYPDLISSANKYYDLVMIDLPRTAKRETINEILKKSDVVVYTMRQNLKQIDTFLKNKEFLKSNYTENIIPLLTDVDNSCKYNEKNVSAYIKEKNLGCIYHNNVFLENASEGKVATFFTGARLSKKSYDLNYRFLSSIGDVSSKIISKFEEIRYGRK